MERANLEQWRAKEVARLFALVDTERRYYQDIVASVPVGLLILSSDLSIRSANRAFRQMFGYRNEDILRRRLEQVLPAPDLRNQVLDVLSSGAPLSNVLFELPEERKTRTFRLSVLPLRNWDDDAEEALLTVEDLSSIGLRQGTAPTAHSAEQTAQGSAAALWEFDPATRKFVYANPAAEALLGFPAEDWTGKPDFFTARIHPQDRTWMHGLLESVIAKGTQQTCEYQAVTATGATIWVREAIRVQRDNTGAARRLFGACMDITAHRIREAQLSQAQSMDALGRLSAKLSHEFNNVLMILSGYSEEVASSLPLGSPAHADMQEVLKASERLATITGQLFSFARRPALDLQETDLNGFIAALAPQLNEISRDKAELTPALGSPAGRVRLDAAQLGMAIEALFAYIVDFRTTAGSRISLDTGSEMLAESGSSSTGLPPGPYSAITISSAGPAIEADERSRLFEPFNGMNTGQGPLGLSSAYAIVRQSGGDISVTSDPINGTRLKILLPQVAVGEEPAPQTVAEPEPEPVPVQKQETILVVEDEAGIRALIRKILSRHGYDVLEASNGEEAVQVAAKHSGPIHMLLTDVMLPQMGGRQLSDAVRERYPNARVLYVSGYNDEVALAGGALPPHTAYLRKPFTLGSLLLKVRELLDPATP